MLCRWRARAWLEAIRNFAEVYQSSCKDPVAEGQQRTELDRPQRGEQLQGDTRTYLLFRMRLPLAILPALAGDGYAMLKPDRFFIVGKLPAGKTAKTADRSFFEQSLETALTSP